MLVVVAIGCGESNSSHQPNESNLRLVAVLYSQYLSAHGGEAPRDEGDFVIFVRSLGPGVLERAGLSGVDELLVSVRDGKKFAVKYTNGNWPLDGAIAYEQDGANGTRYVATKLGSVSKITEEQFRGRHNQPM
jgi:hypothetical protein